MGVERGHRSWQVHVDGHLDSAALAADLDVVRAGGDLGEVRSQRVGPQVALDVHLPRPVAPLDAHRVNLDGTTEDAEGPGP